MERRLKEHRLITVQNEHLSVAQENSFKKIKQDLAHINQSKQQCMEQVNAIVESKDN